MTDPNLIHLPADDLIAEALRALEANSTSSLHITLALDTSSSMYRIKDEAQEAINTYLDSQRPNPSTTYSLYTFSSTVKAVGGGPIMDCPPFKLTPGGQTALYGAIVAAATHTINIHTHTPSLIVLCTDGYNEGPDDTPESLAISAIAHCHSLSIPFIWLGVGTTDDTATCLGILPEHLATFRTTSIPLAMKALASLTDRYRARTSDPLAFSPSERKLLS